jgi:hypothetical protein
LISRKGAKTWEQGAKPYCILCVPFAPLREADKCAELPAENSINKKAIL